MIFRTLYNGVQIPAFGLGTYMLSEEEAENMTSKALEIGYRHIDTAALYHNEKGVGRAIMKSGVPRDEIFVTSKVANNRQGYEETLLAFEDTMKDLGLDYLDLYLIHWPEENSKETWRAFEKLYQEGRVRAIGLSNFHEEHYNKIMEVATIKPMVNQYERHPYLQQQELKALMDSNEIISEAWSPIAKGRIMEDEVLRSIAEKYNKTIPQVILRWQIETGYVVFPKTSSESRLKENINIFDFELSSEDIDAISKLENGLRLGSNPSDRIVR